MSTTTVHALLRKKVLVVTGSPCPNVNFDEEGLSTLSPLQSCVSIQGQWFICCSTFNEPSIHLLDYSTPPQRNHFSRPETINGLVDDILKNAQDPDGKILNGLEFPFWNGDISTPSYASDIAAWGYVRGQHNHVLNGTYPIGHMRWGLAGTANTVTFVHIDSDGFATFLRVVCGLKIWGIYREHKDQPLSSTKVFMNPSFRLDEVLDTAAYDFEIIALRPGDLLYDFFSI